MVWDVGSLICLGYFGSLGVSVVGYVMDGSQLGWHCLFFAHLPCRQWEALSSPPADRRRENMTNRVCSSFPTCETHWLPSETGTVKRQICPLLDVVKPFFERKRKEKKIYTRYIKVVNLTNSWPTFSSVLTILFVRLL